MTPRIYAACLAAYNNGKLHGRWIDVEGKDASDLQEEIDAMLAESPEADAEEYAIHDTEDLPGIGEDSSLEDVCAVAEIVAKHGELGAAVLEYQFGNVKYAQNSLDNYQGTYDNLAEWAEQYLEDTGALREVPESLRPYIDFEKWANDMNGDIYTIDVPDGVAVFNSHGN